MQHTPIASIQGDGLLSPLAGRPVRTRGVVVGRTRKGFFLQDPDGGPPDCSCGLFVFARRDRPRDGALVEVEGKVFDYLGDADDRPTTQLLLRRVRVIRPVGPPIDPVWFDADFLDVDEAELAVRLNRLEGMLVGVPAGSTFVAPSNPFGDYVVVPPGVDAFRTPYGGVRIDPERPLRWWPSFRITRYDAAPRVDVGSRLVSAVTGPLNYRVNSYQIAAEPPLVVEHAHVEFSEGRLRGDDKHLTVMTMNGFNLDPTVENPSRVKDPRMDVDDDVGDQRYRGLAEDVVELAHAPDVIALQEMQDDDGAELTDTVSAERNYRTLRRAIRQAGGPHYEWVDIPPVVESGGGQPGGNIRNAYFYRPDRVQLIDDSVREIGRDLEAFVDSRKPLVARFRFVPTGRDIVLVNVHLASKRHQLPIFAPEDPGVDPREDVRVEQALAIREELLGSNHDVYVTGDFNDHEFSSTLQTLCGDEFVNLLELVPVEQRFDYNHRGTSQALMHGVVWRRQVDGAQYEILHGNELRGVTPGEKGEKATDHAYVVARLGMATD